MPRPELRTDTLSTVRRATSVGWSRADWRPLALLQFSVIALAFAVSPAALARLIPYAELPGAVASTEYSVTVDGQPVPVEKFGEVSYVRFAFAGIVALVVSAQTPIQDLSISPLSYKLHPAIDGGSFSFSLSQPRTLIVQRNNAEKLLIFADGPEVNAPVVDGPGVIDFSTYLPLDRDPTVPVTAELETAIGDVSTSNGGAGGVLYLPSGLYMSAQVVLRSNVNLYLESGALLRALADFNPANYPLQNGPDSSFIYIPDADRVTLAGRGMIDGNGYAIRTANPGGGNLKLLRAKSATRLRIEDLYFRDSARWSFHILYSDDVVADKIRLVNDLRTTDSGVPIVTNTDGFDLDASTFVTVRNSFIYTQDDAFSSKVTNYLGLMKAGHDLTIQNNVLWTTKGALRIGSESLDDMHDIVFDNNDTVLADRLLGIWSQGGHSVNGVSLTNNRTEHVDATDLRSFFDFYVQVKPSYIDNVVVDGLYAEFAAPNVSVLRGFDAEHAITNFSITNMYVAGTPVFVGFQIPLQFINSFFSGLSLLAPGGNGVPMVEVLASDDLAIRGEDTGVFTFSRAGSTDAPLTVQFNLGGTAIAGVDYRTIDTSATIPQGANQVDVAIEPLTGFVGGDIRTVELKLSPDASYRPGTFDDAVIAIVAPEPPTLSVVATADQASESGTAGGFTITRGGDISGPLDVFYGVDGTALDGVDYASIGTSATIPVGASSITVPVLPFADTLKEGTETVVLSLGGAPGYRLGTASSATVSIVDVLPSVVSVFATDSRASENGDPGLFTISRAGGDTSASLIVAFNVSGTATYGIDYAPIGGSVTIPAGAKSASIVVTPLIDSLHESRETVVLTLADGPNYTLGYPASRRVVIYSMDDN